MRVRTDHQAGQYRAELFERLVFRLLTRIFWGGHIVRDFVVPKRSDSSSLVLDFLVQTADGRVIAVEAKAPYTELPSYGINRRLRRLKTAYERIPSVDRPSEVVLAVSTQLSAESGNEFRECQDFFRLKGVELRLWDSGTLSELVEKHLGVKIPVFTIEEMERALRGKWVIRRKGFFFAFSMR